MMRWKEINDSLSAEFEFEDFSSAFAFMTEVAIAAEKQNHHPWWSNVWNKVSFKLCTHDAGNVVTEKDQLLASSIDAIYTRYQ